MTLRLTRYLERIPSEQRPWHLLAALTAAVLLAALLLQPPAAGWWWLAVLAFGTWLALGLALPPRLTAGRERLLGVAYFVVQVGLYVAVLWADPLGYTLLLAIYPLLFNRLTLVDAVVLVVLVGGASVAVEVLRHGGPLLSPAVLFGGVLGAAGAILLGLFIRRITTISDERQALIEQLQATRAELAAAEREAGVMTERQRLAREIHDTLAQGFIGIVTHLESADMAMGDTPLPPRAKDHLAQATAIARDNLGEARRLVWALRPDLLENAATIEAALTRLAERHRDAFSAAVTVTGSSESLPASHSTVLLRCAQEALNNASRHANATQVTLTVSYLGDAVALDVYDDGRGFDPATVTPRHDGGFGLRGMRERVVDLGGTLSIESEPGDGTTVAICLPLPGRNEGYPAT